MPNHVHLILVPSDPDGLRRALATRASHVMPESFRRDASAAVTSGRAASAPSPMDEDILSRPCGMSRSIRCGRGWSSVLRDWRWSRARARILRGKDDGFTDTGADQGSLSPLRRSARPATGGRPVRACGPPRASAGRSAMIAFSRPAADGAMLEPANVGRSQRQIADGK